MEIRIDAAPNQAPPVDTFVSMRVGDVQKQSRLEKSRTYRFPQPQDERGKIGRIEVFKRVGYISVDLDKCKETAQLEVPCKGSQNVALCVRVKGLDATRPLSRGNTTTGKVRSKQRLDAAQQYLKDFNLEEALAEVLGEVIRDKPDNPFKYLSNRILQLGEAMPLKERTMLPPPSAMSTVQENSPEKIGTQAVTPFDTYYKANFLGSDSVNDLALFPGYQQRPKQEAALTPGTLAVVKAAAPDANPAPAATPAAGTAPPTLEATSGPLKAGRFMKQRPVGNDDIPLAVQFLNFQRNMAPSAGGEADPSPKPETTQGAPVSAIASSNSDKQAVQPFRLRPSVGTWALRKSPQVERPWFYKKVDVGEHTDYVRGLQQVISDKDAELIRLKSQIAALSAPSSSTNTAADLKAPSLSTNAAAETATEEDRLRKATMESLLASARDGTLTVDAVRLRTINKDALDELQSKALESLLAAADDGRLTEACLLAAKAVF